MLWLASTLALAADPPADPPMDSPVDPPKDEADAPAEEPDAIGLGGAGVPIQSALDDFDRKASETEPRHAGARGAGPDPDGTTVAVVGAAGARDIAVVSREAAANAGATRWGVSVRQQWFRLTDRAVQLGGDVDFTLLAPIGAVGRRLEAGGCAAREQPARGRPGLGHAEPRAGAAHDRGGARLAGRCSHASWVRSCSRTACGDTRRRAPSTIESNDRKPT